VPFDLEVSPRRRISAVAVYQLYISAVNIYVR